MISLAPVTIPFEAILKRAAAFNCISRRFPANPLGAFTPSIVPLVLHAVLVAPEVSIRTSGFVVVAVPPVKGVPVTDTEGADAAPLVLLMLLTVHVISDEVSVQVVQAVATAVVPLAVTMAVSVNPEILPPLIVLQPKAFVVVS